MRKRAFRKVFRKEWIFRLLWQNEFERSSYSQMLYYHKNSVFQMWKRDVVQTFSISFPKTSVRNFGGRLLFPQNMQEGNLCVFRNIWVARPKIHRLRITSRNARLHER